MRRFLCPLCFAVVLCPAVLCCDVHWPGVVFNLGLVSEAVQEEISQRTEDVLQLMSQGSWEAVSWPADRMTLARCHTHNSRGGNCF